MSKIQSYGLDNNIDENDTLIGTNGTYGTELNKTKNFSVGDLKTYIRSGGASYKVFTALLTQSGGDTEDSINTGELLIGRTYYINQNSPGMDFTNVGAPNNNVGTAFMATGTTPTSWGSGATYTLAYSAGAPVATVLENNIGNIWFTYNGAGLYNIYSNSLFTEDKTLLFIGTTNDNYSGVGIFEIYNNASNQIQLLSFNANDITTANGLLGKTPIEIRVYN